MGNVKKKAETTAKKQQKKVVGVPFKKGQSGNPKGRPVGTFSLITLLKNKLAEVPQGQKKTFAEALVVKMLDQAINEGDAQTQRLILNYIEGMPKQDVGFTGTLEHTYHVKLTTEQIKRILIERQGDDDGDGSTG